MRFTTPTRMLALLALPLLGMFGCTVSNSPANDISIAVAPVPSVMVGSSIQLSASETSASQGVMDVTNDVKWSSEIPTIAVVSSSGSLSCKSPGISAIIASYQGATASINSNCIALVQFALTPTSVNTQPGMNVQLHVAATYSDNTTVDVTGEATWSSGNSAVAAVSSSGLVSCNTVGVTSITASYQGATAGVNSLCIGVVGLSVSPSAISTQLDVSPQLQAVAKINDGTTQDVTSKATWSSGNTAVAAISNSGVLSCKAAGTASITAAYQGASGSSNSTCIVVVGLTLSPKAISAQPGTTVQLHAQANFSDGSTSDVTDIASWYTENPNISAITSPGLVSCESSGTISITVSYQGVTAIETGTCLSVAGITLSPSEVSTQAGLSNQLHATASFSDGSTADVTTSATWNSTSANLPVSTQGLLTCETADTGSVSVDYLSQAATTSVTCAQPSMNTPGFFREVSDEFLGPFNSWTNVKAAYGAIGDGIADDTAALQAALDGLVDYKTSPVIYLPAGTYRVTRGLQINGKQDFSVVGEDPTNTTIKWDGEVGGTMLTSNGSSVYRISRITFDGSGLADTAEAFLGALPSDPHPLYSTFNELSDQHITGVKVGMKLPVQAETAIERVYFDHLSTYGVELQSYNTLDIFIDDSLFVGCGVGVTNWGDGSAAGGNFIVSNSFFAGSMIADMSIADTGYFTARHDTSVSSKTFFLASNRGGNLSQITLQNNTILDPASAPFTLGDMGAMMLIDNTVRIPNSSIPSVVFNDYYSDPSDLFSIGNTFTPNAGFQTVGTQENIESFDDRVVGISAISDVAIPTNVYVPRSQNRAVFEPSAFTGEAIQDSIAAAVASGRPYPVVHLPYGSYKASQTISIPVGGDVQLVGDDTKGTTISWSGQSAGPAILVNPSNSRIKDLRVVPTQTATPTDGLLIIAEDQPRSQIIMDQVHVQFGDSSGVSFDGVEHLTAELTSGYVGGTITGVSAKGGAFRKQKLGVTGMTNYYTGASTGGPTSTAFDVSDYGKLMVQDNWRDAGGSGPNEINLSGGGTFTQQVGMVATVDGTDPFVIGDFDGNVALLGLQVTGNVLANPGASTTNLLALGMVGPDPNYLPSSSGNTNVFNVLDSYYETRGEHLPDSMNASKQWLRTMLGQTRSEFPIQRLPLQTGATRLRISRVMLQGMGGSGIHIVPKDIHPDLFYTMTIMGTQMVGAGPDCTMAHAAGHWNLLNAGDGDFQVALAGTSQVLGVATASGSPVLTLESSTDTYDQRWLIQNIGDGTFQIGNRATGMLLGSAGSACFQLAPDASPATAISLAAN